MLNKLKKVTTKKSTRRGRGYGSGKGGHTAGRGTKGQRSRSGYKLPRPGFEGGQMPLSRRLPKLKGFSRGYFNKKQKSLIINVEQLNKFKDDEKIDINKLAEAGFIKIKSQPVDIKILGKGKLTKKVTIKNISTSVSAAKKIKAAGGSVIEE